MIHPDPSPLNPVSPAAALPRAEDLLRSMNLVLGEYQSFLKGFATMLDAVNAWHRAAPPEEAKRWELLQRQANSLLLQHGVRPTGRVGQPIDLDHHEVVATEVVPEMEADRVVRVLEMGYETIWSNRKLLKRARVVASAAPETPVLPNEPPEGESANG